MLETDKKIQYLLIYLGAMYLEKSLGAMHLKNKTIATAKQMNMTTDHRPIWGSMPRSRKFCQCGGVQRIRLSLFFLFLVDEGRVADRWRPDIECWLGSFVIFLVISTSIAKEPYSFVIFQGVGSWPPALRLWIRACVPLDWNTEDGHKH